MKFRTEIGEISSKCSIDYTSKIGLLGSCFTENIGGLLKDRKFHTLSNPLGISYNPYSILKHLEYLEKKLDQNSIGFNDGLYHHFDFHGKFNHPDKSIFIENLAIAKDQLQDFFSQCDVVIISLGTAYVFEKSSHGVVNNCHKLPSHNFERKLLPYARVVEILSEIKKAVYKIRSEAHVIFTVSPVKHIRDGLIQNRRSKSILHAAIHEVIDDEKSSYFPSYEILVDDLRDYRFYKEDLIHPSEEAVSYIWQLFKKTYLSSSAISQEVKIEKIMRSVEHRPINPEGKEHQKFLNNLLLEMDQFSQIDFTAEKEIIHSQIIG